jgi:hypothetical protein
VAALLRPGNACSNTAADHIETAQLALAQLPQRLRRGRQTLIRTDSGGGTHAFLDWLSRRGRWLSYSVGMTITDAIHQAVLKIPKKAWTPAYDAGGTERPGAWVAEITDMPDLSTWPTGMRLIVRKERPHPGAQLRFTDLDGLRLTCFATNTKGGQLADLELRHRRRARCEDRIRGARATGLRNLPLHDTAQNRIWLEIVSLALDLLAWMQMLALSGDARRWEPKKLRLRLFSAPRPRCTDRDEGREGESAARRRSRGGVRGSVTLPYVVLRDAVSPSYGSSTQGCRVWLSRFCGAHGVGLPGRHGRAAAAPVALGLSGPQPVVRQFPLEVALEFAGGRAGLHHELHGGQQFSGARLAGGEVHRGERTVVDAQGETGAVQDVEHVEDVPGATHQAEHLGDVHRPARPRVGEQFAELRPLQRVEAAGSACGLLEDDRVLDPGLVQDEVLTVGRLLVGRHPLVDQAGHSAPRCGGRIRP